TSARDAGALRADATRPEARPGEPRLSITVRGYREADRGALSRICIEESNLGTLKNLAPVFFLDPHCDDDPSSCFVAELTAAGVGRGRLEQLGAHGAQGAVLISVPGGPAAVEMWERLGFASLDIPRPNGSRVTWLLAIL